MTHIHYEKDVVTTDAHVGANVGTHVQGEGHVQGHSHGQAAGSHLVGS